MPWYISMRENIKLIKKILSNYNKNIEIIKKHNSNEIIMREESEAYIKIEESEFRRASREVELRNLLFLQLEEDEKLLLNLKYLKNMNVHKVSEELFISNRQFFRKQKAIMDKLDRYVDEFKEIFEIK
ncbi:hypothetical protein [Helcococcus sueciensis]|nr:hypothetical protein [Helcococcus sueciensis]